MQYLYQPGYFPTYQVDRAWEDWAKNNKTLAAIWAVTENDNLVRLWVLADMLCMPELCEEVLGDLDCIIKESGGYSTELMRLVFELTGKGSALQEHVFESCRTSMAPDDLAEFINTFPIDVQQELLAYIIRYNHENPEEKRDWGDRRTPPPHTPPLGSDNGW